MKGASENTEKSGNQTKPRQGAMRANFECAGTGRGGTQAARNERWKRRLAAAVACAVMAMAAGWMESPMMAQKAAKSTTQAKPTPQETTPAKAGAPPAVLVVTREYLKPGMGGQAHAKSESAFVHALEDAKYPVHYVAADAMSGPSRTLFFLGFNSFADWQKSVETLNKDSALAAAFDNASQADGSLLQSYDTGVFVYMPEMSLAPAMDLSQMRYLEITRIKVRLGHAGNWQALSKMHNDMFSKLPGEDQVVYQKWFGTASGEEYIVITPLKSLAELDAHRAAATKAWAGVSEDQRKRMNVLEEAAFQSVESNLFAINPRVSYVDDAWKKGSPDFWDKQ